MFNLTQYWGAQVQYHKESLDILSGLQSYMSKVDQETVLVGRRAPLSPLHCRAAPGGNGARAAQLKNQFVEEKRMIEEIREAIAGTDTVRTARARAPLPAAAAQTRSLQADDGLTRAKVLVDCKAQRPTDLTLVKGDVVVVMEKTQVMRGRAPRPRR